mmetsp:Transcript_32234/g.78348  ORF Transcript_32234/g.78348 Transcript_32234/m.78348 type:complete len:517 (+) Transcript_32234:808-2358(+)
MLRSSPTSRGNGNMRSRPSTPAGASRSSDRFNSSSKTAGDKFNYNNHQISHDSTTPNRRGWADSSSDNLRNDDHTMTALHESRDEMEEEEFNSNDCTTVSNHGHHQQHSSISRAVPGRATRQLRRRKRKSRKSIWSNLFLQGKPAGKWSTAWQSLFFHNDTAVVQKLFSSNLSTLVVAVALWYSLGIISISTSKLLLLAPPSDAHPMMGESSSSAYYTHVGGMAPIMLTLQQLLLGSTFLRFLLSIQFLQSPGVLPLASLLCDDSSVVAPSKSPPGSSLRRQRNEHENQQYGSTLFHTYWQLLQHQEARYLCFAGFCFSLGFYCTNLGFQAASAAFVETIKASEPITSAILAVAWGLELLNRKEVTSLALIVCGVVLSTLGNSPSSGGDDSSGDSNNDEDGGLGMAAASLISCMIVMTSNLCFSFRGLFQKLFQKKKKKKIHHHQNVPMMDDLNLQYRMQQMGVLVFGVPALLWEGRSVLEHIYQVSSHVGLIQSGVLIHYVGLATVNAMAFASYK